MRSKPGLSAAWVGLVATFGLSLTLFLGAVFFHPTSEHDGFEKALLIAASALALGAFGALLMVTLRARESERRTVVAEHHLQTAIDSISEGFVIFDKDEAFVMCNDQYRALYPQIADKLVPGTHFSDLAHAMTTSGGTAQIDQDAQSWHEDRVREFRNPQGTSEMQMADGRWILLRDRKLPDGGSVGIRTDITEIKKREQALIDSERHHRDLIERAPVAIYVHRDNIILYANSTAAEMLGYQHVDQVIGKDIFDLIHPDHHRLAEIRLEKASTSDSPLPQADMKFICADGSVIYTEAQVSPVMFDNQPALESILRNITGRRRMERALMESEQRYRTLFELAPDAMLVHDGRKILFANAAAGKIFGAKDERGLLHLALDDILPRDASIEDHDRLAHWHQGGQITSCRLRRLDQNIFDAEVVTAPTNYQGEAVCHTVIRDVTQRKLVDATMAQNAKLASLGGMAAGLAHELSQPLNIMRFAAEGGMLKMDRGKADDALHLRNYKLIQDQAERMGSIMDSMRIFSRKDPGPIVEFDVSLCIRDIVHLLRNPFRVDNVHINVTGAVSGLKAMGSPIQLEQVLLNLLKNARDSIVDANKGNVTGWNGQITIDCQAHPERHDAVIRISDNGGGIGADDIGHIFDPFFTTKEIGQGTGLGLSLSHEIIVGMSGTLSAVNTADGACFTIALPLCETSHAESDGAGDSVHDLHAEQAASLEASVAPIFKNRHVLVVEDEAEAARAMADYLTEEGFTVTTANDGKTGLAAYRTHNPDVVITDIRMPGFSGTELIQELRRIDANLPIIAVTGHLGETETIASTPGSAPVDVMKKPVSLMELSQKIGDLCIP
ncbi:PAS domain S-box protein [Magnetovibrio sp.]|uniref:PAS domain S-box protein n=1 Tax=Magnetovibrio sp. TaxID=2024836 RepID=UPI002F954C2E